MIREILTLGVLYFVQGLPYGFQDKFIPMYLRTAGLSHTKLSLMKLLLLPWLCKAAFGILVDFKWSKWLWLLLSLGSLTFISFVGIFINTDYFFLMCLWLFFLNLFSAFQDVSVDALALHFLKECEKGHNNHGATAQVVGYKLGSLFGGGFLFWIHYYHGWQYLCLSMTSLYIMSIVTFLPMYFRNSASEISRNLSSISKNKADRASLISDKNVAKLSSIEESHENLLRKRIFEKLTVISENEPQETEEKSQSFQSHNFCEIPKLIFTTKGTIPVIVFLLLYKLGERGVLSTFPIFLVDQGIPPKSIGLWSGLVGQSASLAGSVCAGWVIARKCDLHQFLNAALLARTIPMIVEWVIVNIWFSALPSFLHSILFFFSISSLIALEFIAGLVTTSVFTLMMSCSLKAPPNLQVTHYSVLSSVETAGKLIFSSLAGALIDWMGLGLVYFIFILLSALSVCVLPVQKQ